MHVEHRCVLEGVGSTVGLENLLISRPLVISLHTSNPRPHLWCKAAIFFNHHHERRRARSSRAQVNTRKGNIYGADLADCCANRRSRGRDWISAWNRLLRSNKCICNCGEPSGDVSEAARLKTLNGIHAIANRTIRSVMPAGAIGRAGCPVCYCLNVERRSSLSHQPVTGYRGFIMAHIKLFIRLWWTMSRVGW